MLSNRGAFNSRILGLLLACSLVFLTLGSRAQATELGVYEGGGCTGVANVPAFNAWNGKSATRVVDFIASASWSNMVTVATWAAGCWKPTGYKVMWSIPMLPSDNSSTLAVGATGAYNQYYVSIGKMLVSKGFASSELRIGWEFNGSWYAWTAAKDPTDFINYFRQIVSAFRSVPGQNFKIIWCPAIGTNSIAPATAYPGDDVVDYIGMDIYNVWWASSKPTPTALWSGLYGEAYGVGWLATFSKQHGKPIAIPEWGTGTRPDGHGGGDDPNFIDQMSAFIAANNVAIANYWDYPASDYNSKLSAGGLPLSGAEFLKNFGVVNH